jgi:hypothetical protein
MGTKTPIGLDEHKEIGRILKEAWVLMGNVGHCLKNHVPITGPEMREIRKAHYAINKLRHLLDDKLLGDYPDDTSNKIYTIYFGWEVFKK